MEAIFLVEFDTRYGRTLAFQEPARAMPSEEFDAISDYLIPKPSLCDQLILIREAARVVLCWPVCLEDERYDRNAFLFSLGFIVRPESSDNTHSNSTSQRAAAAPMDVCHRYGPVLRKACGHLAALERESELLSNVSRKGELAHLLPQLLYGLREHGRCAVAADAANTIHLQLPVSPPRDLGLPVEDHLCPVLLALPVVAEVRLWDLTLQRLLRWIDGTRHVAEIAAAACTDLPLVRQGLQALQGSGWVRMIDRFDLNNAYACQPALHALANDAVARQGLVDAVRRPVAQVEGRPLAWAAVLKLFAAFRPAPDGSGWRTARAVAELYPDAALSVDLRALVHTGLLNGLLRRVHTEPIAINAPAELRPNSPATLTQLTSERATSDAKRVPAAPPSLQSQPEDNGRAVPLRRAADAAGGGARGELARSDDLLRSMLEGGRHASTGNEASPALGFNGRCTLDAVCARLSMQPNEAREAVQGLWPDCAWISR